MPVFNNSLAGAAGSGGAAAGYKIERSLRFNSSDQSKLTRTPSAQSSTKTWTLSWWMKAPEVDSTIFAAGNGNVPGRFSFGTNGNGAFFAAVVDNNSSVFSITTDAFFRDPSAWYHCCLVCDSTAATQADRFKIIVNGVRQTVTGTLMPQNQNTFVNTTQKHQWSGRSYLNIDFADGYLADIQFVDGQAIDPDGNFGEFDADTGVWNPIEYTGSYNTPATGSNPTSTSGVAPSGSHGNSIPSAALLFGISGPTSATSHIRQDGGGMEWSPAITLYLSDVAGAYLTYYNNESTSFDVEFKINGSWVTAQSNAQDVIGSTQEQGALITLATTGSWTGVRVTGGSNVSVSGVTGIYKNGTRLHNGSFNGFHLNFSDNSSNTALGFDARVSGTRYSNFVTGFQSSYPPANMFDGSTSTFTLGSNGGGVMTFTPGTAIPYTAAAGGVELYLHSGSQPDRFRINGGSWVNQTNAATGGWQTISTGDGSITKIEFQDNGNNAEAVCYAIRVNGTILTDPSGANDWTVNNLTAHKAATGPHGVTRGTSTLNYDPSPILDGSLDTNYQDRPINGNGVNFTGIPTANTQLRIYYHYIQSGTMTTNGGHVVASGNLNGAWSEPSGISYPFTLTSISVTGGNSGDGFGISAIEVDGTILTTGSGANTDSLIDSPTNYEADSGNNGGNYATLSSIDNNNTGTLSNGNLDALSVWSNGSFNLRATIAPTSGKFYWEYTMLQEFGIYGGILLTSFNINTSSAINGNGGVCMGGGSLYNGGSVVSSSPTQAVTGDVMGFAWDVDNRSIEFFLNGSSQGTVSSIAPGTYAPAVTVTPHSSVPGNIAANFGQRPFFYPPGGTGGPAATFKSLCTQNLEDPLIADGSDYFDVVKYTGNGGSQTISGLQFEGDLFWLKSRSAAHDHWWFDRARGLTKALYSNATSAEYDYSPNGITATSNTGFTLTSSGQTFNSNNVTYAGWVWDGGSSTVSNTDGSITSTVRANPTAGFSIVKASVAASLTGGPTIGHGLNKKPEFIIGKNLDSSIYWYAYHKDLSANHYLIPHLTNAEQNSGAVWGSHSSLDSNVFQIGADTPASMWIPSGTNDCIFYVWTSVENYSAFGKYTGNGSTNGPFVYTGGFQPAFILCKSTNRTGENWYIWDSKRDGYNFSNGGLFPNQNYQEGSGHVDILSNGFKLRSSSNGVNGGGDSYIWAAFAENPFKYARAR